MHMLHLECPASELENFLSRIISFTTDYGDRGGLWADALRGENLLGWFLKKTFQIR